MDRVQAAQDGVTTDATPFAEYLTFALHDGDLDAEAVEAALASISAIAKSIGQKDLTAKLSVTAGFNEKAWRTFFPERDVPQQLRPFPELSDGPRHFPATPGDVFIMIKSTRMDLNFQVARHLVIVFRAIADVVEDVQGFKYLDDRDFIDFVDGTENPQGPERFRSVVLGEYSDYPGGSYLVVQRYVDRHTKWDALSAEEQENVIGRTKWDDIEQPDDVKRPYAHNNKSKVTRSGTEMHMLRQNRPWGTGAKHGTMFVGFAADLSVIEDSLRQMITADEQGYYDHLLDFVDVETGLTFFCPPAAMMQVD